MAFERVRAMRERGELGGGDNTGAGVGILRTLVELRQRLLIFIVLGSALGVLGLLYYQRMQQHSLNEAAATLYAACGVQAERVSAWHGGRARLLLELEASTHRSQVSAEQGLRATAERHRLLDWQLRPSPSRARSRPLWLLEDTGRSSYLLSHFDLGFDALGELSALLARWPVASRSIEQSLLRVNAEQVQRLAVLGPGFSKPYEALVSASARAAQGERGVLTAPNEHGEKVLAAVREVDATGWLLLCSIELDEAELALRRSLGLLVAALLACALATFLALLLSRRGASSQELCSEADDGELEQSLASEALLRTFFEQPRLVAVLLEQSGRSLRLLRCNQAFADVLDAEADTLGEHELDETDLPQPMLEALRDTGASLQAGLVTEPWAELELEPRFVNWRAARLSLVFSPSAARRRLALWIATAKSPNQNGISSPIEVSPPPAENSSS